MIKRTEFYIFVIISLLICAAFNLNYIEPLEVKTQDYRFLKSTNQSVSNNVVLATITDEDIQNYGPWPFRRSVHARLIDRLKEAGASVIGFDIIFSVRTDDETSDNELVSSLAKAGNVILANRFVQTETLVDSKNSEISYYVDDAHEDFKKVSLATGFVNVDFENLNPDGVIRNVELFKNINNEKYISFSLKLAQEFMRKSTSSEVDIIETGNSLLFGDSHIPLFTFYQLSKLSLKKSACYTVKYNGNSKSGIFPVYSYTEILDGLIPKSAFKNRIVIVGAQSSLLPDIKLSPLGTIPGMEINAQIVDNVINGDYISRPYRGISTLLILLLGFLCYIFLIRREPSYIDFLYIAIFLFIVLSCEYILYLKIKVLFEMVAPVLEVTTLFVITRFYQLFIKLHLTNVDLKISNFKLERKVTELSVLYDISKTITTISDMKSLFKIILDKTINIVNAEYGVIMVFDDEEGEMKAKIESADGECQLNELSSLVGEVANNKKTFVLNRNRDYEKHENFFNSNEKVNSLMLIPLMTYSGMLSSVIFLANTSDGSMFSENDVQLTSVIATQAGFAIENANLYHLAVYDGLTSLYVRRYFLGVINKELKRIKRHAGSISVMMTDIDHFKKFNDTYGHQIGDLVLKSVANVVKNAIRETDIASRYGGEEFILLLPDTDSAGASIFAERLRKSIETSAFESDRGPLKVTISIGIASLVVKKSDEDQRVKISNIEYSSVEDFIKCADIALYNSKESGRNCATAYSTGMQAKGI